MKDVMMVAIARAAVVATGAAGRRLRLAFLGLGAILCTIPAESRAATQIVVNRSFELPAFSWSFDASTRGQEQIFYQELPILSFAAMLGSDPQLVALDRSRLLGTGTISLALGYHEDLTIQVQRLASGQVASAGRVLGGTLNYDDGTYVLGRYSALAQATCVRGSCANETRTGMFDAPEALGVSSGPLAIGGRDIRSVSVALLAQTVDVGRVTFDSRSSISGRISYTYDLSDVATAVPEPATWAMMIAGLGATGGALRRGRKQPVGACDRARA